MISRVDFNIYLGFLILVNGFHSSGITLGVPRPPALKEVKNPLRPPMLFTARRRGALLIMPRPLSGCQIKAEIKGFLLMYCLFLY